MKSAYLLFGAGSGTQELWRRIEQSRYGGRLAGEMVALLQGGDALLVLLKGESDLRQRVSSLVAGIRQQVILCPFTYAILVQHEDRVSSGEDWTAAYFDYYGGSPLLGAVYDLINSPNFFEEFVSLVEHLRYRMKDGLYGSQQ